MKETFEFPYEDRQARTGLEKPSPFSGRHVDQNLAQLEIAKHFRTCLAGDAGTALDGGIEAPH